MKYAGERARGKLSLLTADKSACTAVPESRASVQRLNPQSLVRRQLLNRFRLLFWEVFPSLVPGSPAAPFGGVGLVTK